MRNGTLAIVLIFLAACTPIPDLGAPARGQTDAAFFPRIEPIDGLIIKAIGPGRSTIASQPLSSVSDPLLARAELLKRRAALLRGSPVDDATRAQLAAQ